MNDIHDNLPPIALPWFTYADWGIMILFIAFVLIIFWKIFSSSPDAHPKFERVKPAPVPQVFHFSLALKELKELQKKKKWKDFSLLSTNIFKQILEQKYKQPFFFATGSELYSMLSQKGIPEEISEDIQEFFQYIDPVKFAHRSGKDEIADEVLRLLTVFYKYFSY